jgi:hypothetical protein
METLEWQNFKAQLSAHPDHHLQFEYAENTRIRPSFHITEIKLAPITSVDCGGKMNAWTEVIVQIWEPEAEGSAVDTPMKVAKALSIIELVERSLPISQKATVKIEFGNTQFDTRQLLPRDIKVVDDNLVVDLRPDTVQCKAIDRGQTCGTNSAGEECCGPLKAEPAKMELLSIVDGPCCTPGSGCC